MAEGNDIHIWPVPLHTVDHPIAFMDVPTIMEVATMATMGEVDAEANIVTLTEIMGVALEGVEIMAIMGVALEEVVIMAIMGVIMEEVDVEAEGAASVMEAEATMVTMEVALVAMEVAGVAAVVTMVVVAIVVTLEPTDLEVATKIRIPVWMISSVESELAPKIHPRKAIVLSSLMHETLMRQKNRNCILIVSVPVD